MTDLKELVRSFVEAKNAVDEAQNEVIRARSRCGKGAAAAHVAAASRLYAARKNADALFEKLDQAVR